MTAPFAQGSLFYQPPLHKGVLALSVSFADSSPVAVPGIFVAFEKASSSADRCHSLSSLYPPPAALASLPPGSCLGEELDYSFVSVSFARDSRSVRIWAYIFSSILNFLL